MNILSQLSSQSGDKTEQSNLEVVRLCLENSSLLDDIAEGLAHKDADLAGDCAEVFTKVAEQRPELVAPYAEQLATLLNHKKTRARWEAVHALALVAALAPEVIRQHLDTLATLVRTDSSVIVRDYSVDALGNYGGTGSEAAHEAYPVLMESLTLWEGKQAARALNGLGLVAKSAPDLRDEIMVTAQEYLTHGRAVVQKAAKSLAKGLS